MNYPGVYLSLNDEIFPNHGCVDINDIGSTGDTALLCKTNRPPFGPTFGGHWFAPDGTRLGGADVPEFTRNRGRMVVRLKRSPYGGVPAEGVYQCRILDNQGNILILASWLRLCGFRNI